MIGRTISHFRVVARLGAGAMGEVYAAEDTRLGRRVALKLVARAGTDDQDHELLLREAQVAASLNHPNICTVHEVGEDEDGRLFIAMELVKGRTLADVLAEGALPREQACRMLDKLAAAMAHAHAEGIVHRDLKPANIMVTDEGEPKIMDFGIALRQAAADAADSQDFAGTLAYIAPEQVHGGDSDEITDVWSLGVVFYEMLTGDRPFAGDYAAALLYAITHGTPTPVDRYRGDLAELQEPLVDRLLATDRTARFHSMDEVRAALAGLGSGADESRRPRRLAAFAVAALVMVVLVWRLWPGPAALAEASVAILPLQTSTDDAELKDYASGFSGEVIAELTKVGNLRVIAQSSMRLIAEQNLTLGEIADRLGVAAVMGGTIRVVGENLRISAELIDPRDDRVLWADSFESIPDNALILQASIARAVAATLKGELDKREERALTTSEQIDPEAHKAYLKAMALLDHWGNDRIWNRAIELLRTTTTLEPSYAPAWAALARIYHFKGWFDGSPEKDWLGMNRAAIAKALALDPDLPQALIEQANTTCLFDLNWAGADSLYRRALELAPGSAYAHNSYAGAYLTLAGRCDEAIEHSRRAVELSPLDFAYRRERALVFMNCRRFEDSLAYLDEVQPMFPRKGYLWWFRALDNAYLGRIDAAVAAADSGVARGFPPRMFAPIYWLDGRKDEAWQMCGGRGADPNEYSVYLLMLEQRYDEVLDALEARRAESTPLAIFLLIEPIFDPLRDQPRFVALGRGLGMPGFE